MLSMQFFNSLQPFSVKSVQLNIAIDVYVQIVNFHI